MSTPLKELFPKDKTICEMAKDLDINENIFIAYWKCLMMLGILLDLLEKKGTGK